MERFNIRLEGVTPLLINRITEEELLLIGKFVERKKFQAPKDPREAAEKRLYLTTDKQQPFIPTSMLMSCLIAAGVYTKLDGKRQMSSAKSTLLPGFITLEDPYILLLDPSTNKPSPPWEVDMRPGRNPNGGEAVCIIRPRFDRWRLNLSMLIDTAQIGADRIRELVDNAGVRLGLGDFRPQRKGIYGQFKVGCWDAEKTLAAAAE